MNKLWSMYQGECLGVFYAAVCVVLFLLGIRGEYSSYMIGFYAAVIWLINFKALKNKHLIFKMVTGRKRPILIDLNHDIKTTFIIHLILHIGLIIIGYEWYIIGFQLAGFVLFMSLYDHEKSSGWVFWILLGVLIEIAEINMVPYNRILLMVVILLMTLYVLFVGYRFKEDWMNYFKGEKVTEGSQLNDHNER